jgi:tRNA dimethylallyltransferase
MNINPPLSPNSQSECPESGHHPKIGLIAGPTASGKSAIAMALAKLQPITIINADASQVYRDIPILSAAPTANDMAAVPHALFGHIDGHIAYNAAAWAKDARVAIDASVSAGRTPVLVGGTGLYIRTLLHGIAPVPEIDADIRAHVRAMDVTSAYDALLIEDFSAADALHPADTTRIMRALEVVRSTGHTLSFWQKHLEGGIAPFFDFEPLILLPPRAWLYDRCDARFAMMLENGALAEVSALLRRNIHPDMPVMRAIGIGDIALHLAGETSLDDAIARGAMATRHYAKRQYTWFNNQLPTDWPRINETINDSNIHKLAIILRDKILT